MNEPRIDAFALNHIKHALIRAQEEGVVSKKTDMQISYTLHLIALAEAAALPSVSEMIALDSFAKECRKRGSD